MKSRFDSYIFLIALPVVAFVLLGVCFLFDKAPKLIRAERREITEAYRETAELIVTNSAAANWRGEREKGWRQISKLDRKFPWGVVERGGGVVLVWVEGVADGTADDRLLAGIERGRLDDFAALWIYGGFGFAMGFVLLVAVAGIFLLKRYDREREAFLAGMIHDLRNPLVAIRGIAERDPGYAAELADAMLMMVRNAQDFLGLGGRRAVKSESLDLVPLLRGTYRMFADDFEEEKSGAVEFALPDRLAVAGDPDAVRRILWNLFSNAAKYSAPYGAVKVRAFALGRFAKVEFSDRGRGMTPRQRRRAFDRFFRAGGLHEAGKGGFGLGLPTARDAARRMGGDLTLAPNLPSGCVFTLSLPAADGSSVFPASV